VRKLIEYAPEELAEFQRTVGRIVVNLSFVPVLMSHERPLDTIRGNYLRTNGAGSEIDHAAREYVNDLFTMKSAELCAKWIGDERALLAVRRSMTIWPG
jgi:hypothetical protein